MKTFFIPAVSLLAALCACAATPERGLAGDQPAPLADCNVVWDSPSKDSFGSMPLSGIRGAGANVWFQDGALWVYLGHNGSQTSGQTVVKPGALRLTPVGVDFANPKAFRQELDLPSGAIRIAAQAADGTSLAFRLWFAGETLVVESTQDKPLAFTVEYASWRARPNAPASDPEHVTAAGGALRFIHDDGDDAGLVAAAKAQGVPAEALPRVTHHRVFGGALVARGGLTFAEAHPTQWQIWKGNAWSAQTVAAKDHLLTVALGATKELSAAAAADAWQARAAALLNADALAKARQDAQARWDEFWNRSHVFIATGAPAADPAAQVGRNFQRFRYMTACNQGGELPLKFNGGIFTTDPHIDRVPGHLNNPQTRSFPIGGNPDFLRWGNWFPGQNQRWIGWPTLADGDGDILGASTAFYRDRVGIAEARAANAGAQGACYTEMLGLEGITCVGQNQQGLCGYEHLTHHFVMGLEHAWMTLRGHSVLGGDIRPDLRWMVGQIRFYDSFYRARNKARTGQELLGGKLRLDPVSGLELVRGADTVETVAALRRVTEELLKLPELSAEDRAFLGKVQPTLPEIPTLAPKDGRKVIAPAGRVDAMYNSWELPELYTAWPYRLTGVLHPETLPMLRATWENLGPRGYSELHPAPVSKRDLSWQAQTANMAAMGWTGEAEKRAVAKLSDQASCMRFPAFFGPGHDWMPDHNWGGSGLVGVQEMLMACDDDKILLLPAWPKGWDVDFKLHAPRQTTVECTVKGGKVVKLEVTPASRRKDVEIAALRDSTVAKPLSEGKPVRASSTFEGYDAAKAVDGDPASRWASAVQVQEAWLEVDLGEPTAVSRAVMSEVAWPRVEAFAVEAEQADGSWKTLVEGTMIRARKEVVFPACTARKFRLNLKKLSGPANIEEFQLFAE